MTGENAVTGAAVIQDPTGLHARPAVKLTKLAKGFVANIEVCAGPEGRWVNAKSPNAVMKLKARHGEQLQLRADGDDACASESELGEVDERAFHVA